MRRDPVVEWQALSRLYEEAEALDPPALACYIAEREAHGEPLLPELKRMLRARDAARRSGFLEAAAVLVAEPPSALPPAVERWRPGEALGPWRLLRHIGAGGMSEVWLAERADGAFRRQVAIKLLHDHPGRGERESYRERFRRERDILAALDHPHIAGLQDAGITADGQPWLAVEHVDGAPITAWCDARRLDVRARVALFRQVLMAVEHAHAHLVVHRDLKPSNVFVDARGQVKLLDFGIAKLQPQPDAALDETALTRIGGRPLTLRYASPEQRNGGAVTTAADVYAASVLLYELLSGRPPIERPQVPATEAEAQSVPAASRTRPDAAAIAARGSSAGAWRRAMTGDLDAVLARGMAFDPAQRYPDARSLREDLERWLAGHAVHAKRTPALARFAKFVRRHRAASAATALGLVAIVTLAVLTVLQGQRAEAGQARAVLARDFVVSLFALADPQGSGGKPIDSNAILAAGEARALETLGRDPMLQADVLRQVATMQGYAGDFRGAERNLARAATTYAAEGRSAAREAFEVALERSANAVFLGQPAQAREHVEAAAARLAVARGVPLLEGRYWVRRAVVSRLDGDAARSATEFARGLGLLEGALGVDHVEVVDALRGLAHTQQRLNQPATADATLRLARERAARNAAVGPRDRLAIDAALAVAAFRAGRYAELRGSLEPLLVRCERDMGDADDLCTQLAGYLGLLGVRLDDPALRRAASTRLVRAARDAASPWRQAGALNVLALIAALDHLDDPAPREIEARLQRTAASDLPPRDRRNAQLALGMRAVLAGDAAAALEWIARAENSAEAASGNASDGEFVARAQGWRALAEERLGRGDAALAGWQRAVDGMARVHGEDHVLTLLWRCNLVALQARRGDASAVTQARERLLPLLRASVGDAPVLGRLQSLRPGVASSATIFH